MVTLEFPNVTLGKTRYEICTQAILLTQKTIQLSEYDDVIALLKKFKSIGVAAKEKIGKIELYDLREDDDGYSIELERSELRALIGFVKQPMWRASVLLDVKDVMDWLDALDKNSLAVVK